MARFHDLPVELVAPILASLTIDDILSLRLSNSQFCGIVNACIDSAAYDVARSTFPRARLLLRPPKDGSYDFRWLKSLVPLRLAAIVLDKDKCFPWRGHYSTGDRIFDGLSAEDDNGDKFRARVANGWRVLKLISNVYRDVYARQEWADPDGKAPWAQPPPGLKVTEADRSELGKISRREYAVWIEAVSLILRLKPQDCVDFFLLFRPLVEAFRTSDIEEWRFSWYLPPEGPKINYFLDCTVQKSSLEYPAGSFPYHYRAMYEKDDAKVPKLRHLDRGNTWLTAYILREGPSLFWEQWQRRPSSERQWLADFPGDRAYGPKPDSDSDAHYIRDRIREAWAQRTPAVVHVERECAARIWYALFQRAEKKPIVPPATHDSLRDNPINHDKHLSIEQIRQYRKWFFGMRGSLVAKSEWSWHEWQLGKIGIHEEVELDTEWVRENAPTGTPCKDGEGFFGNFESLDDVNYQIWL